jgi:hypothetical protein
MTFSDGGSTDYDDEDYVPGDEMKVLYMQQHPNLMSYQWSTMQPRRRRFLMMKNPRMHLSITTRSICGTSTTGGKYARGLTP